MDDLNEKSSLFAAAAMTENEFVKLIIPLAAYEPDAKFYSDGWQTDNFS